jgi:O-methyltransferase
MVELSNPPIIAAVRSDHLTYLEADALRSLYNAVKEVEHRGVDGILVEAGCALGGSAIVMATAKSPQRPFYVYDVFGMIPPPSQLDESDVHERYQVIASGQSVGIDGNRYYGYEENLIEKVTENFRRHGVQLGSVNTHLVKGLFQETMHVDQPIALAHIDGDWYESVMTCLTRLVPNLARGGIMIIDDYRHWAGCRKAVDEYFLDKRDEFTFIEKTRLHVVRQD